MFKELTLSQKILFGSMYGFLALMVIFSVMSMENAGENGLQKCIDRVVDQHEDGSLSESFKVIYNCCAGAGGKMIWSVERNTYICDFD